MSRFEKAAIAGVLIWTSLGFVEAHGQTVRQIGVPESERTETLVDLKDRVRPSETQAIWGMIGRQDWAGAQSAVDAVRRRVPGWTPPSDMLQLINAGQTQTRIDGAVTREDWPTVLNLVGPVTSNMCRQEDRLWARFNALIGLKRQDDLSSDLLAALMACDSIELRSNLILAVVPELNTAGASEIRTRIQSDPKLREALADFEQEASVRADKTLFQAKVEARAFAEAFSIAKRLQSRDAFMELGWAAREPNASIAQQAIIAANQLKTATDSQVALALLENDAGNKTGALDRMTALPASSLTADQKELTAAIALALADKARVAKDIARVQTLTKLATDYNPDVASDAANLLGASWLASAQQAFDDKQFADAISLAENARAFGTVQRPARMLQAWSHYQSGNAPKAQAIFAKLYQEAPDVKATDGLQTASASSLHTRAIAKTIASNDKAGLFRTAWRVQRALDAEAKGHFLKAYHIAPEREGAVEGVHRFWVFAGAGGRFQSGTSGADALDGSTIRAAAGGVVGRNRFEVGAAFGNLNAGSGTASNFITSPYAGWHREGDATLSAKLGLSPIGGPTSLTVLGTAAIETEWNSLYVRGELKRISRADSTLSLFGAQASDGAAFGRVTESGADISGTLPLPRSYSVSLGLSGSFLDGVNIASNARFKTRIDFSKSIQHKAFRYLSTGPFYQFDTYRDNSNFFTLGHGGFFSPQAFHLAGWALNFETKETRRWILRGNAALSYENIREDSALLNPLLDGPQPLIGGSSSDGISGAANFDAAYQVTPRVAFVGSASLILSDAFLDVRTTFGIRFTPGGRRGLTRHDLAPSVANTDLWRR